MKREWSSQYVEEHLGKLSDGELEHEFFSVHTESIRNTESEDIIVLTAYL